MTEEAWEQAGIEQNGSRKPGVHTLRRKHESEKVKWKQNESMNSQCPPPVMFISFLQDIPNLTIITNNYGKVFDGSSSHKLNFTTFNDHANIPFILQGFISKRRCLKKIVAMTLVEFSNCNISCRKSACIPSSLFCFLLF